MILGTTITIPDPSTLTLPEFQPLWAWVLAVVLPWYSAVALRMRSTGSGRRIYSEWKRWVDKEHNCDGFCPLCSFMRIMPEAAVITKLALSPVEYLIWTPIKAIATAPVWLTGAYTEEPKKEASDTGPSSSVPTSLSTEWVRWQDAKPLIGSKVSWKHDGCQGGPFLVVDGDGRHRDQISYNWIKANHPNAEWKYHV